MSGHSDDLFAGTAGWYARHRPGYPPELIAHLAGRFGLDGTGRLLDLGCGTGQLALPLAAHVAEVVGMDPDAAMLAEAAAAAGRAGVGNAAWLLGGSRDVDRLAGQIGPVRLVVMGRSFHWMEGAATLRALDGLIAPGGGLALVSDGCGVWSGGRDWQRAVGVVIRRWLGETRRAGGGTYAADESRWEDVLARSPFRRVEAWGMRLTRRWTADGVVGLLYSTSFCAPPLLGANRPAFEADLRAALAEADPQGDFEEEVSVDALLAWRD